MYSVWLRLLLLKNFASKFFKRGRKYDVYLRVKFSWELTQIKRFPEQEKLFCKLFTTGGGMCSPLCVILGFWQTSSHRARSCQLETSVSLHLETRASWINGKRVICEEHYLRKHLNFQRQQYISRNSYLYFITLLLL